MKHLLKELILEFQQEPLPAIIKRLIKIPHIPEHVRKAHVFIGMRRVGKTYLMYQHIHELLENGLEKEKILYLNFEDDRLAGFKVEDFQTILDIYFELYPNYTNAHNLHFYFDEIQNIDGWDKFIRRLIDKEKASIFITGSSAKTLSKEIATSLRGRCLTNEVFPLGLIEYLNYLGITEFKNLTSKKQAVIKHHCQMYLSQGGFPETLSVTEGVRHQIIQSYVNTAVFRDVIERHSLSQPHIVKLFLIHCLQNIASSLSITKIYKTLKSRGEVLSRSHLYAYLDYFEDAYLLYKVPLFDFSNRKRQVNPSKIYCTDPAIIMAYSMKPEMERGICLENAVFLHLRKEQHNENIFYYKTKSGKEIDFVAQKINGSISLYQVCLDLQDNKTKEREISALIEASSELKINQAYIITNDFSDSIQIDHLTIEVIPYWKWVILRAFIF
jgi:predicted AAA+ superfamily ATPase